MTNLNPIQRKLLAAADPDGVIVIADGSKAASKALIKLGLAIWTPAGEGGRLIVTAAGRAIGADQEEGAVKPDPPDDPASVAEAEMEIEAPPVAPTPRGKIATLVALLRRPEGATVEAMMSATGWQAHSVRGGMSGAIKKTLGLTVLSEKTEAGRVYRIPATSETDA